MDISSLVTADEGSCGGSQLFALQVLGDDMMPEFEKGDVIVIDPSGLAKHEGFVIVELDGELTFRQLKIEDKRYFVCPMIQPEALTEIALDSIKGVIVQKAARRGANKQPAKHYY